MKRRTLLKNSMATIAGLGAIPGLTALLQACDSPDISGYEPAFLSARQYSAVEALAETILPATETPGASDAGVAPYIDLLFAEFFDDDQADRLATGLNRFMETAESSTGSNYDSLSPDDRSEYLSSVASSENQFFREFKELVMWAYFTSEAGMKTMDYQPVPGRFDGCITTTADTRILAGNR